MKNKKLNTKIQTLKSNHAITLIALIITIVVMLILVAVTLSIALGDNGVVNSAKEAKEKQILAQKEEEIITNFSIDYSKAVLDTYGISKTLDESTVKEMAQICIDTGISPDKLTVHYNLYNAKANKTNGNNDLKEEVILYRIDKVTAEERIILEEKGLKSLRGDITLDGYITVNDRDLIPLYDAYIIDLTDLQIEIGDINSDMVVEGTDTFWLDEILSGNRDYDGGYIS